MPQRRSSAGLKALGQKIKHLVSPRSERSSSTSRNSSSKSFIKTRQRGQTNDSIFNQQPQRPKSGSHSSSSDASSGDETCYLVQTTHGSPVRVGLSKMYFLLNGYRIPYENIIYWGHTKDYFKISYVENLYHSNQRRRDLRLYAITGKALSDFRKMYPAKKSARKINPVKLASLLQARIAQLLEEDAPAQLAQADFKEASPDELRQVIRQVDQETCSISSNDDLYDVERKSSTGSLTGLMNTTYNSTIMTQKPPSYRGRLSSIRELDAGSPQVAKRKSTGEIQWGRTGGQGNWEKQHSHAAAA